jgi:tRNA-2-methylthio-N6-dimethylallyladenosine synthase
LEAMQRLCTREEYMERIGWMKASPRNIAITTDIIVGFPGETEEDLEATLGLLDEVQFDSLFGFKYSRRPNTAALALDQIPEDEKTRRLMIVQEHQRNIQIRRNAAYVGSIEECMVEGFNKATSQWIGRTSQHKTLNFLRPGRDKDLTGQYLEVRVTRTGPNSLVGEAVN